MENRIIFPEIPTLVIGGGDLGSGVVYRLKKAGFPVLVTELEKPLLVRRKVAYGSAVAEGNIMIDGILAQNVEDVAGAKAAIKNGHIPVLIDPYLEKCEEYKPRIVVDARMTKNAPAQLPFDVEVYIGLGPGFIAGENCDALIETMRGHHLGRVIWEGSPQADTGIPGAVKGVDSGRVLRAPCDGVIHSTAQIGDLLEAGDMIAHIDEEPLVAPFPGVLRGLVHDGLTVKTRMKVGDVDPRSNPEFCFTISDKSLAIGGGVLEAVFSSIVFL